MAAEKWTAAADRGTVLTTELNALGNGAISAPGSALPNQTNMDRYFVAELKATWAATPTDGELAELYAVPDGGGGQETRDNNHFCGSFKVENNAGAQILYTEPFLLPPFSTKFTLLNRAGTAMTATGHTVKIYSFNRTN